MCPSQSNVGLANDGCARVTNPGLSQKKAQCCVEANKGKQIPGDSSGTLLLEAQVDGDLSAAIDRDLGRRSPRLCVLILGPPEFRRAG